MAVRVLVVCGAAGTGKTVTAWEIGHQLAVAGIRNVVIDADELDRVWPRPTAGERVEISERNLRAFWSTYADRDHDRLVLAGVMASLPPNRPWIGAAVPDAEVVFVRLTASRLTRIRRLRARETGTGFSRDIRHSDKDAAYIEANDPADMLAVMTDGRSVTSVANEVLRLAGWVDG